MRLTSRAVLSKFCLPFILMCVLASVHVAGGALALGGTVPSWQEPVQVSANASGGAYEARIETAPNGDVLIAYNVGAPGSKDLYYVRSTSNGYSWSAPTPIYNSNSDSENISIAFDSGNEAHAVWREGAATNKILYSRQGQWGSNSTVTVYEAPGQQGAGHFLTQPDIVARGTQELFVVWSQRTSPPQGTGQLEIYAAFSTNNGTTWSAPQQLSDSPSSSQPTVITDSSGNLHVAWEENDPVEVTEIHYRRGGFNGSVINWENTIILTEPYSDVDKAIDPTLDSQGNIIHLAFGNTVGDDDQANQHALYMSYIPGSGWSAPVNVTPAPLYVNGNDPRFLRTALSYCLDNVYLYYHGTTEPDENERIFGANQDSGWAPQDEVNTGNVQTSRAINPVFACNGDIHLAYEGINSQTGVHQVYYIGTAVDFFNYLPVLTD